MKKIVRIARGKIYCKILFWGIKGSGKKTMVKRLYRVAKKYERNEKVDVRFTGPLSQMPMDPEEELFFEGAFQNAKNDTIFFQAYTFTGDAHLDNKRSKKLFRGTDGIVFLFDGQQSKWKENAESLSFLKKLAGPDFVEKIPMIFIITKTDLPDTVKQAQLEQLLKTEGFMQDPGEIRSTWNPLILEVNLKEETVVNAYNAFTECVRRVDMYQMFSSGNALASEKNTRINLVIPEALKSEWERFSGEVVHASMSQMIRDAVREYMKKMKQSGQQSESLPEDQEGQTLEKMIERTVAKKLEAMLKKI